MYRFLLAYIHFPGLLFSSIFTQPLEQDLVLSRSNTPIVNLGYAQYAGVINTINGNTEFLGIRYAAPPTGTLSCRSPHPIHQSHDLILQEVCAGVPRGHHR